jgi:hypothetical protein
VKEHIATHRLSANISCGRWTEKRAKMLGGRFKHVAELSAATILLSALSVVLGSDELTADPEVAVQNVFRQILNIRPPSEPLATAGKVFTPPKHMLELYQKYAAGGGPKRTTGSTVRSILPTKGTTINLRSYIRMCLVWRSCM